MGDSTALRGHLQLQEEGVGNGVVSEQIAEGCSAREMRFPASLLSLINTFSNPGRAELPPTGVSIPTSVALWSQSEQRGSWRDSSFLGHIIFVLYISQKHPCLFHQLNAGNQLPAFHRDA